MDERTILVVEDDADINALLAKIAAREGFGCVQAYSGTEALLQMERAAFDLVLLDMMLPGMDGPTLMACMRDELASRVPVIVVSAKAGSADKVGMLAAGADDYVTKPYSARELIARIRAVLRRRSAEPDMPMDAVLTGGPVRMDIDRHVVTVNGEEVPMPLKEFELLEILLRNVGRVMTRGQLIERVWGADYVGDTKTLDVHIKRLRSKIEPDSSAPRYVVTVRGLGYKFEN